MNHSRQIRVPERAFVVPGIGDVRRRRIGTPGDPSGPMDIAQFPLLCLGRRPAGAIRPFSPLMPMCRAAACALHRRSRFCCSIGVGIGWLESGVAVDARFALKKPLRERLARPAPPEPTSASATPCETASRHKTPDSASRTLSGRPYDHRRDVNKESTAVGDLEMRLHARRRTLLQ